MTITTSYDKCREGKVWEQWECVYKAPGLVWEVRGGCAEEGKFQAKTLEMGRRWEGEEGRKDGGGRGSSKYKGPQWEEEHHAVGKLRQAPHALPTESRYAPQGTREYQRE